MNPGGISNGDKMVTCRHCFKSQRHLEFFDFCEFCKKPLDLNWDGDLSRN